MLLVFPCASPIQLTLKSPLIPFNLLGELGKWTHYIINLTVSVLLSHWGSRHPRVSSTGTSIESFCWSFFSLRSLLLTMWRFPKWVRVTKVCILGKETRIIYTVWQISQKWHHVKAVKTARSLHSYSLGLLTRGRGGKKLGKKRWQ